MVRRRRDWLRERRPPTEAERRAVLREPLAATGLNAACWLAGAVIFAAINAPSSLGLAAHVGTTILLGGLTTCAIGYLLVERLVRPVTALALSSGPAPPLTGPGVQGRLVLAWLFASGVPILGLVLLALHILLVGGVSADRAGTGMLALGLVALVVGLVAALFSARSVADPLCAVRDALARVEAGDLSAEVPVDDSSEIGLLQNGFNRMAAGLRERERMRDLFGRHVGQDVARAALEQGEVRLGGEARDVAVIFVDLVGSTPSPPRSRPIASSPCSTSSSASWSR